MSREETKASVDPLASTGDQNEEWIVQSKPSRRLVPQHSLTKQDLAADKNKDNNPPAPATGAGTGGSVAANHQYHSTSTASHSGHSTTAVPADSPKKKGTEGSQYVF